MATGPAATHLLETTHDLALRLIELADTKASILIGFASVLTGVLIQTLQGGGTAVAIGLTAAGVVLGVLTSLLGIAVILPRTNTGSSRESLIFFKRIARVNVDQYRQEVLAVDSAEFDEALLLQNHSLALIQEKKYALLVAAIVVFAASLLLGLTGLTLTRL